MVSAFDKNFSSWKPNFIEVRTVINIAESALTKVKETKICLHLIHL